MAFLNTSPEAHWGYAYLDLLNRGESAVPLMKALAEELKGTRAQLGMVMAIPGLFGEKHRSFAVDYFRQYIREHPKSAYMTDAVRYLEHYGNADDVPLMRWIGERRPQYTEWMEFSVKHLQDRLRKAALKAPGASTPRPASDKADEP